MPVSASRFCVTQSRGRRPCSARRSSVSGPRSARAFIGTHRPHLVLTLLAHSPNTRRRTSGGGLSLCSVRRRNSRSSWRPSRSSSRLAAPDGGASDTSVALADAARVDQEEGRRNAVRAALSAATNCPCSALVSSAYHRPNWICLSPLWRGPTCAARDQPVAPMCRSDTGRSTATSSSHLMSRSGARVGPDSI
jgi:hypothetical protein